MYNKLKKKRQGAVVHHSFELFLVTDVLNEVASYMLGSGSSYETILPAQNVMV